MNLSYPLGRKIMNHLTEIKINQLMNWTELQDAVCHNCRVDIIEDIDAAIKLCYSEKSVVKGSSMRQEMVCEVTKIKALCMLATAAESIDFGDYDGELQLAEEDFSERVDKILHPSDHD
jgi:hypothetical protein